MHLWFSGFTCLYKWQNVQNYFNKKGYYIFFSLWYTRWDKMSGFCDCSSRRAELRLLRYWWEGVPRGMNTERVRVVGSSKVLWYHKIETSRTQNLFSSSQTAVSIWKPNHDHALAPQLLTVLWVGRSAISLHYCVPPQFREINKTEDMLTFWGLNRRGDPLTQNTLSDFFKLILHSDSFGQLNGPHKGFPELKAWALTSTV